MDTLLLIVIGIALFINGMYLILSARANRHKSLDVSDMLNIYKKDV